MRHTPFDGSSRPFTIGLKPLDPKRWPDRGPAHWIDWDARTPQALALKADLLATRRADVLRAEPATLAAQAEVLDLVLDHLGAHGLPGFQVTGTGAGRLVTCGATGTTRAIADWAEAPLALAGLLVPEDLVLMRAEPDGTWRLAAACLCFPSHWSLAEKFGRPLEAVHDPVPGVNERLAARINRIFHALRPGAPVWRQNWSLCTDPGLFHPDATGAGVSDPALAPAAYLRVEHQTLHKLAVSGDVLFTIKIAVDPLSVLESREDGARLAALLRDDLAALRADELAYKRLTHGFAGLWSYLDGLSARVDQGLA